MNNKLFFIILLSLGTSNFGCNGALFKKFSINNTKKELEKFDVEMEKQDFNNKELKEYFNKIVEKIKEIMGKKTVQDTETGAVENPDSNNRSSGVHLMMEKIKESGLVYGRDDVSDFQEENNKIHYTIVNEILKIENNIYSLLKKIDEKIKRENYIKRFEPGFNKLVTKVKKMEVKVAKIAEKLAAKPAEAAAAYVRRPIEMFEGADAYKNYFAERKKEYDAKIAAKNTEFENLWRAVKEEIGREKHEPMMKSYKKAIAEVTRKAKKVGKLYVGKKNVYQKWESKVAKGESGYKKRLKTNPTAVPELVNAEGEYNRMLGQVDAIYTNALEPLKEEESIARFIEEKIKEQEKEAVEAEIAKKEAEKAYEEKLEEEELVEEEVEEEEEKVEEKEEEIEEEEEPEETKEEVEEEKVEEKEEKVEEEEKPEEEESIEEEIEKPEVVEEKEPEEKESKKDEPRVEGPEEKEE